MPRLSGTRGVGRDKRVSDRDPLGCTLEQERPNGAIRKVDTLCEFSCCGSTDTAASAGYDRDPAFVQDWVGGLV